MPKPRQLLAAASSRLNRKSLDSLFGGKFGRLLGKIGFSPKETHGETLVDLAGALLSVRGRASGPALASTLFDLYEASDIAARQSFLGQLHSQYPRDAAAIDQAITAWRDNPDEVTAARLHEITRSPCQTLIRLLNLAPGGTRRLIAMRDDLLNAPVKTTALSALDAEFQDAFETWFNAGFLELRRIDWASPAGILEKIIRYEAVHSIRDWDDLRRRVEPVDRRCYAFFHPQMADDPLIFVEVALTNAMPNAIAKIITEERATIAAHDAQWAIFYSISNCQNGLRGIPFGNFLIKQVAGLLQQELPQLGNFATLSPVPGFAKWLAQEVKADSAPQTGDALRALAADYLLNGRTAYDQVIDPVARFHLGNGARLEAVHADADLSPNGLRQSHGVMVNYVYDLGEIEANHLGLAELGKVAASKAIEGLAKGLR